VGANVGETISLTLNNGVAAGQIGQIAEDTGDEVTAAGLSDGGLTIQVGTAAASSVSASVDGSGAGQELDSAFAKAAALNAASVPGLTVTATNSQTEATPFGDVTLSSGTYDLTVNGTKVLSTADDGVVSAEDVVSAVNLNTGVTGVSATVDDVSGAITFNTNDGRNITLQEEITGGTGNGIDATLADDAGITTRGSITLSAAETIQLGGSQEANIGFTDSQSITVDDVTLSSINVLDVDESNNTIKRIDSALTSVSSLRSNFGAIQNRFESTIANLQAVSENLSASRSRIQDADFAAETAALTRAQILQQAGVSILAQANSSLIWIMEGLRLSAVLFPV
jgi:flagellin